MSQLRDLWIGEKLSLEGQATMRCGLSSMISCRPSFNLTRQTSYSPTGFFGKANLGSKIQMVIYYTRPRNSWLNRDPLAGSPGIELRIGAGNVYELNPWEASVGPNLYAYVYNAPPNYVDNNGRWGIGITGGAAGDIGLGGVGAGVTGAVGGGAFWGGPSG